MKFFLTGLFLLIALVALQGQGKRYLIETKGNNKRPDKIKTNGYKGKISHPGEEYHDYREEFEFQELPSVFSVVDLATERIKSEEEEQQITPSSYYSVRTNNTTSIPPIKSQRKKEAYEEKKTKEDKLADEGEEEVKKEFTFKCEQGLNTNCGEDGKCKISCGDGNKFEMTCPNKGSIESIENNNGLSRIRCGKKIEFPPCFPFCKKDDPQHNYASSGTPGNQKQNVKIGDIFDKIFKPCFPFCNNNQGIPRKEKKTRRESRKEKGWEEKTKKENHMDDGEEEIKKEFEFKCNQDISNNCNPYGMCNITCGDGKQFEMSCPNNMTIKSIENDDGLVKISCGKKGTFILKNGSNEEDTISIGGIKMNCDNVDCGNDRDYASITSLSCCTNK